ncbi:hypothetical protein HDV62DRAFT_110633 [Trichoderma sp. SZMC 28011]
MANQTRFRQSRVSSAQAKRCMRDKTTPGCVSCAPALGPKRLNLLELAARACVPSIADGVSTVQSVASVWVLWNPSGNCTGTYLAVVPSSQHLWDPSSTGKLRLRRGAATCTCIHVARRSKDRTASVRTQQPRVL